MLKLKKVFFLFVCMVTLFAFSGCDGDSTVKEVDGKTEREKTAVCVLIGDFSNSKNADCSVVSQAVDPLMSDAEFTVCVLDGNPEDEDWTVKFDSGNRMSNMLNSYYSKFIKFELNSIYEKALPKQKQTDILKGLWVAEKVFRSPDIEHKKLVIFSTGISTTGYIDFSDKDIGLLSLDAEGISGYIAELNDKNLIPDLSGVEVVWYNFGETKEPQIAPNRNISNKIKKIWTDIFAAAGVSNEVIFERSLSNLSETDEIETTTYPYISPVVFDEEEIIWHFTDETVQFNPKYATFVNPDLVLKNLEPYAQRICKTVSKKFIIVGSTATYGNPEVCLTLSLERAEAVKDVLCSLGVPEDMLETYGIGQNEIGNNLTQRVDDEINGKFNEEKAKKNRKVMVVDMSTDLGKALKNALENSNALKGKTD